MYTAFVTPIRITFIDEVDTAWFVVDLVIDVLFFLDIMITFNSTYYNAHGELVTDRRTIGTNYLKTYFVLDVLAILPFSLIVEDRSSKYQDYFKLTRLPRLYRLIKIIRKTLKKDYTEILQDLFQINSIVVRVIKFLITVLICVHIMGCFWYYSAKLQAFGPGTWVYELALQDESPYFLYVTSIYWAVATISTVGFGDVRAFNTFEMIISIFWMIFGVGFYSFTIGSLSTLLAQLDTRSAHLQNKITFMDEFCEETQLSKQMKDKIRRVLIYNSMVNVFSSKDRDDFLVDIPSQIKYQIAEAMYNGLRSSVSFFRNKDSVFISSFIPKLQPLKVLIAEFVYHKGEYPNQGYTLIC